MLLFEMFKPSARQLALRQLSEAQRLAIKHAADFEEFTAAASASAALVRMYQDRAARISGVLDRADAAQEAELEVKTMQAPARPTFPASSAYPQTRAQMMETFR